MCSRFFSNKLIAGSSQQLITLSARSSIAIFIFAPICGTRGRLRPKQISCFLSIKSAFILLFRMLHFGHVGYQVISSNTIHICGKFAALLVSNALIKLLVLLTIVYEYLSAIPKSLSV